MEKRWEFRHLRQDVRILTRGLASSLDRASAEHPEVATQIARQLFERLRSESERRATLLAMTDLTGFDAHRCSTPALQQNVLDRIARKRDLLLVHDKETEEHCCPSERLGFRGVPQASTMAVPGSSTSRADAARERPSAIGRAITAALPERRLAMDSNATAQPVRFDGDSSRWSLDEKLRSMHRGLRPKVTAVLQGLSRRGFQPKIHFAWRSVAVQLELFRMGSTKVKFSFHNAQFPDGTPNAHAADVVDARYGWSNQAKISGFWLALGEEAHAQNLYWGGDWKTFRDWAHIQLVPNSMLAGVRKESGL